MKKSELFLIFAAIVSLGANPARADEPAIPPAAPAPSQYETLWTKSPFAVATAEAVESSPDYSLVGVTVLDGVSYASVIERQTQEHFLITSDKPVKGLILKTITRNSSSGSGMETYATVEKDGQPLTLKLEAAPLSAAPISGMPGEQQPNSGNAQTPIVVPPITQNIPMPGSNPAPSSFSPNGNPSTRFIRIHRPTIHLPPMPQGQPASGAPAPTPTAQPVQPHNVPPR